jgi:hypothetical protein
LNEDNSTQKSSDLFLLSATFMREIEEWSTDLKDTE